MNDYMGLQNIQSYIHLVLFLGGVFKRANMSTTTSAQLPRITPRSTCVSQNLTTRKPKVVSAEQMMKAYSVYPARLPSAPEGPQRRLNVLRPPPPKKFNHMLETIEPHWHNEKRTNNMKQREHYRYHNAWSKYYYGSPAEQEEYRYVTFCLLLIVYI